MSSLPEDKPSPLWPWVVVSLILFVSGLFFLRPDPNDVESPMQPLARSSPGIGSSPREGTLTPEGETLRFVYVDSANSSFAQVVDKFCARINKISGGRLKVKGYAQGEVDGVKLDELGILKGLQDGQISFGLVTCSPLTNVRHSLEVLDLPFLFQDYKQADKVLLGPLGKRLLGYLEGSGLVGLGSLEVGFRVFSSALPITTMADFKGKRMRVMQSLAAQSLVQTIGGKAVPSPVDKIYQMAKEGYIDAADRTYPTYWDFKLYEVQGHISETRHSYTIKVLLTTDKIVKSLNDKERKALDAAVRELEVEQRKLQRNEDLRVKKECLKRGIKIHEFSAAERGRIAKACESLYNEYSKLYGKELLDDIRATKP